jgi:hypothetical protein
MTPQGHLWREGDPLLNPAGDRVVELAAARSIDGVGPLGVFEPWSGGEMLHVGGSPVLRTGDPFAYPVYSPSSFWLDFNDPVTATGFQVPRMLVRGTVFDPHGVTPYHRAMVGYSLLGPGSYTRHLVAYEGQPVPSTPYTIQSISLEREAAAIARDGRVLWYGDLETGSAADDDVVMLDTSILLREGDPAFPPGGLWGDFTGSALDRNYRGDWILRTRMDGTAGRDEVVVMNHVLLAQEGSSHPSIAPYTFEHTQAGPAFGNGPVAVDPVGRALWFGRFDDPNPATDAALFYDGAVLVREGTTLVQGRLLEWIDDRPGAYALAPGGGYTVFHCILGAPGSSQRAVCRMRLPLGDTYCQGQPCSTGASATLDVFGSVYSVLNHVSLRTRGLPPGTLTLMLVGTARGFVANPGGSQGDLCLGGSIGRFNLLVGNASAVGTYERAIDLFAIPQSFGPVFTIPGTTWTFQTWFRDANPTPTNNFSSAVEAFFW